MALRSAGVVGVLVLMVADVCRYLGTWRLVRPGVGVPEAQEDKDITQVLCTLACTSKEPLSGRRCRRQLADARPSGSYGMGGSKARCVTRWRWRWESPGIKCLEPEVSEFSSWSNQESRLWRPF